ELDAELAAEFSEWLESCLGVVLTLPAPRIFSSGTFGDIWRHPGTAAEAENLFPRRHFATFGDIYHLHISRCAQPRPPRIRATRSMVNFSCRCAERFATLDIWSDPMLQVSAR